MAKLKLLREPQNHQSLMGESEKFAWLARQARKTPPTASDEEQDEHQAKVRSAP